MCYMNLDMKRLKQICYGRRLLHYIQGSSHIDMLMSQPDQISQARKEQEMLSTVDNSASEVSEANLTRDEL